MESLDAVESAGPTTFFLVPVSCSITLSTAVEWGIRSMLDSCEEEGETLVSSLLEQNVQMNVVDTMGDSPLHIAMKNEKMPLLKLFIPNNGKNATSALLQQNSYDDCMAIHIAMDISQILVLSDI